MRSYRRSVIALAVLAVAGAAAPAHAADDPAYPVVDLGFKSVADLAVANSKVYLTSGAAGQTLLVVSNTGEVLQRRDDLPGPTAVELSADRKTLYVALSRVNAVAALDAGSLREKSRIDMGGAACIGTSARTGRFLWFGHGCGQWGGDIARVDLGVDPPAVTVKAARNLYGTPPVAAATGNPDVLLAGERGLSPASIYSFTVGADGTLTLLSEDDHQLGGGLADIGLSPDGRTAYAGTGGLEGYAVGNLGTPNRRFANAGTRFAVHSDGRIVSAAQESWSGPYELRVFTADTLPTARAAMIDDDRVVSKVEWAVGGRRAFAVTEPDWNQDKNAALHIVPIR